MPRARNSLRPEHNVVLRTRWSDAGRFPGSPGVLSDPVCFRPPLDRHEARVVPDGRERATYARARVRGAPEPHRGRGLLRPGPARAVLAAVSLGEQLSPLTLRALRALSFGLVDHLELRSLAIDAVARC